MSDNGPRCPSCETDDVVIQGSSSAEYGHCPLVGPGWGGHHHHGGR